MNDILTADEFAGLPSDGTLMELVRGIPRSLPFPFPGHGEICGQVGFLLMKWLTINRIGRANCNSGIITRRDPDSVRGTDVAFYSFARLPADKPLPSRGYSGVARDVVFEVRSYTDGRSAIHGKVAEYLEAGVDTVVVLDEQTQRAWMYRADVEPIEFDHESTVKFPAPSMDGP